MKRRDPAQARQFWTTSRLAGLDTETIVARLRRLGLSPSPKRFAALAAKVDDAWGVSEFWREQLPGPLPRHDDDFLGLAACELWKRYCPETPSIEMLDDRMQQGYRHLMEGRLAQACDQWSDVWQVLCPRLQPEMRTCDDTFAVFHGAQHLHDWVQDFALELQNAALDNARYAELGIRLCEDVLRQFSGESDLFIVTFRADLGRFHYLAGRPQDGERVLCQLILDHPDTAAGYVRLADTLAYGARHDEGPIDVRRAVDILESALAVPVSDAAEYDLQARLEHLRESAARPGSDRSPL